MDVEATIRVPRPTASCGGPVATASLAPLRHRLDRWSAMGVGGFVCMVPRLRGWAAPSDFTADPGAEPRRRRYDLQRRIRDSRIVARARDRGMKLYLGFYLVNYFNTVNAARPTGSTTAHWSDSQPDWPRPRRRRRLGFAGPAFDHELYPQEGNVSTATCGGLPRQHRDRVGCPRRRDPSGPSDDDSDGPRISGPRAHFLRRRTSRRPGKRSCRTRSTGSTMPTSVR